MIEIYLFVNPLGKNCFKLEQQLLQFIEEEYGKRSKEKMQFRFLPLVNLRTIGDVMQHNRISQKNLAARNHLFSTTYSAALDCKAAQFQGKKKGRQFLFKLQEAVGCHKIPYSSELAETLFAQVGGDIAMFKEDRQSEFVKEVFFSDQKIAREMGITKHPSAVVYNYSCEYDFGVLVEGTHTIRKIKELCKAKNDSYQIFDDSHLHTNASQFQSGNNYLYLLSN
ncbi:ClpXP adapter SpxH family protein [Enterococcus ratti]|uniref:Dithiol-disulfide isomerase n=1 Tax=Enterococcus ratti TaxID=150033 RepID=A0A1L8WIE8_9ENTE|nr:ClpXP adapter SpxH family protein [Enterococcus ratti]OJG80787.1 dithiol-disulfide isomerase [Enterococcus ratti]